MFLCGISTRKVGKVLDFLCGGRLSVSKISTVVKELNYTVYDIANNSIEDDFVPVPCGIRTNRFPLKLTVSMCHLFIRTRFERRDSNRLLPNK
ncbi:MAG: hypothetical protein DRP47_04580 [Candidatus Zixiibacteriota bacterium]|nr:MAG: hypothetical protein DRP47_04580 [candidate division Zixibacteria bacterium]